MVSFLYVAFKNITGFVNLDLSRTSEAWADESNLFTASVLKEQSALTSHLLRETWSCTGLPGGLYF